MHGNITGLVSAGDSSAELPSQLIGIELCSAPVSSGVYQRAASNVAPGCIGPSSSYTPFSSVPASGITYESKLYTPCVHGPSRGGLSPSLPLSLCSLSCAGLCNHRTKNRQPHDAAVVSTIAVTAAGTTTFLVDALLAHVAVPRALLLGRSTSKSEQASERTSEWANSSAP